MPNMVVPFFIGFLLDHIGIKLGMIIFCTTWFISTILMIISEIFTSYLCIIFANLIIGLSVSGIGVIISKFIIFYFKFLKNYLKKFHFILFKFI